MQIKKFSTLFEAFFFSVGVAMSVGGRGIETLYLPSFFPKQFLSALNYNLDTDHVLRELHMVSIQKM